MSHRSALHHFGIGLMVFASSVTARSAYAQDSPSSAVCTSSFEEGQRERLAENLIEARELFRTCANSACMDVVRGDCAKWSSELDSDVPTVVFKAHAPDGSDLTDVVVSVDGKMVTQSLTGKSFDFNPGKHKVTWVVEGRAPKEQSVVLKVGDRYRVLVAEFTTPSRTAPEPAPAPTSAPALGPVPLPPHPDAASDEDGPWVAVGVTSLIVGGVGLALGGVMGALAFDRLETVKAECGVESDPPIVCDDASLPEGNTFAHVSTAGFIVGGVGVALGVTALAIGLTGGADDDVAISLSVGPQFFGVKGSF